MDVAAELYERRTGHATRNKLCGLMGVRTAVEIIVANEGRGEVLLTTRDLPDVEQYDHFPPTAGLATSVLDAFSGNQSTSF
jgi:hypothetical protein